MATFRQVAGLLDPAERRRGSLLFIVMIFAALADTLGVTSIMPFLAVLGSPKVIETHASLRWLYERGGFTTTDGFLFALGVLALVMVLGSALVRAFAQFALFRFASVLRHSLSLRLLQGYLRQPYEFFLSRNSADLAKKILSDVDLAVTNYFVPGMQMVAYFIVAATLVGVLFLVDAVIATVITVVVSGAYFTIYASGQRLIRRIGQDRVRANADRFTIASEVLGGIKDVKLLGREEAYTQRFEGPSLRFAKYQATNDTLIQVPRYAIEAIGFGGILALALVLLGTRESLGEVLPVLGVYVFAGYRLLPAAQNVYQGAAGLRFTAPVIELLSTTLAEFEHHDDAQGPAVPPGGGLALTRSLAFDRLSFQYSGSDRRALCDLDLEIPANTTVGFVGSTGAGKTTAVDLILGLLSPTGGCLRIDGKPLGRENLRAWQRGLGYVPQQIFLADTTVAGNIAFGVKPEEVDRQRVEHAARVANIHDFIVDELPGGYDAMVGERGVRLSGGQRQRIGIARALYHDPSVLVLDEATSALDNATEAGIMKAVAGLQHSKTIIMIAHRLSTVRDCDRIVVLEAGRIVGLGTYDELLASNKAFQRLASGLAA